MAERLVVDASAMVDLLLGATHAAALGRRVRGHELHVPAHFDAEVLSALGRLVRAKVLGVKPAGRRIERLASAPIQRHPLDGLLTGAWRRRHNLRLVDALYVELAMQIEARIVTIDADLAAATPVAEYCGEGS